MYDYLSIARLRPVSDVYVLMLTAKADETDTVVAPGVFAVREILDSGQALGDAGSLGVAVALTDVSANGALDAAVANDLPDGIQVC
jgi:hypothetical protein